MKTALAIAALGMGLVLTMEAAPPPVFTDPVLRTPTRTNLLHNPVLIVAPDKLDFGWVEPGSTATNTFLIENAGGGMLTGQAIASAPFRIVQGGVYSLGRNSSQVVTLTFTPGREATNTALVKFTGGGGVSKEVIGRSALFRPRYPRSK